MYFFSTVITCMSLEYFGRVDKYVFNYIIYSVSYHNFPICMYILLGESGNHKTLCTRRVV